MAQTASGSATRSFFADIASGIVLFPVWWYTRGLLSVSTSAVNSVKGVAAYFALGVWVKNFFVPMYGETTLQGRLISIFMRFWMIVLRGIGVGIWTVMIGVLWLAYVLALPYAVLGMIFQSGLVS